MHTPESTTPLHLNNFKGKGSTHYLCWQLYTPERAELKNAWCTRKFSFCFSFLPQLAFLHPSHICSDTLVCHTWSRCTDKSYTSRTKGLREDSIQILKLTNRVQAFLLSYRHTQVRRCMTPCVKHQRVYIRRRDLKVHTCMYMMLPSSTWHIAGQNTPHRSSLKWYWRMPHITQWRGCDGYVMRWNPASLVLCGSECGGTNKTLSQVSASRQDGRPPSHRHRPPSHRHRPWYGWQQPLGIVKIGDCKPLVKVFSFDSETMSTLDTQFTHKTTINKMMRTWTGLYSDMFEGHVTVSLCINSQSCIFLGL